MVGKGVDDMFAVMMSTGTVIIYSGTDPSSIDCIGLWLEYSRSVGLLGIDLVVKLGGDLIVMTEDGFVPSVAVCY